MNTSPPLRYAPVYVGLWGSLVGAVTCNAYLDSMFGIFGFEVFAWSVAYAVTLWVGWRQQGEADAAGRRSQRGTMIVGVLALLLLFLPIWGIPRAFVYFLAATQAAYNCITTTRRQMFFGLLVASGLALFAAGHVRADWTMLFYLVPCVVAVVFTLVAEQIDRRNSDLAARSLGGRVIGGQGVAIAAASIVILATAQLLYSITPHVTWQHFSWRFGQDAPLAGGESAGAGAQAGDAAGQATVPGGSAGQPQRSLGDRLRGGTLWRGMPRWQVATIETMANVSDAIARVLAPARQALESWWEALKRWLREHLTAVLLTIGLGGLIAVLVALALLLREVRPVLWLRTRVDRWRYGRPFGPGAGRDEVIALHAAIERLLRLREIGRPATYTVREHAAQVARSRHELAPALGEMTTVFERSRYAADAPDATEVERMRRAWLGLWGDRR